MPLLASAGTQCKNNYVIASSLYGKLVHLVEEIVISELQLPSLSTATFINGRLVALVLSTLCTRHL